MDDGRVLWTPSKRFASESRLSRFIAWLDDERGRSFDDYDELWRWSVDDLEGFWGSIWEFFAVPADAPPTRILSERIDAGGVVVRRRQAELRGDRPRGRRRPPGDRVRTGGRLRGLVHAAGVGRRGRGRGGRSPRAGGAARRSRGRVPAQHPRGRHRVPGVGEHRGDLVVVLAGLRRTGRDRSFPADPTLRPVRGRALPLRRHDVRSPRRPRSHRRRDPVGPMCRGPVGRTPRSRMRAGRHGQT